MIHDITAGHFDPANFSSPLAVEKSIDLRIVRKLLRELGEIDQEGQPTLGGWKVRFDDGCVIVPWLGGRTNYVAEEFAIRLWRATGCTLADREHGRVIEVGNLTGLADVSRPSPMFARARRFIQAIEKGWSR